MSFWVYLEADQSEDAPSLPVETFFEGGTRVLGGCGEAELNVTYNYSKHYYEHLNGESGLRGLYGKQAKETIDALRFAVAVLGTERSEDYWKSTPGNAGAALALLLSWAEQHPDGYWRVS